MGLWVSGWGEVRAALWSALRGGSPATPETVSAIAPTAPEVLAVGVPVQPSDGGGAAQRGVAPAVVDTNVATFIGVVNPQSSAAVDAKPLIETEEITATVGRCVECVAVDFAACPMQLFDVSNREKPIQLFEHPALELFEWINPVWQPNLFWQHVIGDLMTEGNSFNWIDIRRGEPLAFQRFMPHQMHVIQHPTKLIGKYVLVDEYGEEYPYDPNEIMHIRTRNLSNPVRGLGQIARLRNEILTERQISSFQYHRFKNGLPTGLIIQTTRSWANEEELREFTADIRRKYAGVEKAGAPMVFQQGEFKVDQIARPSEEEIGFIKSMEWTRGQISMMFGVPPSRLSIYSDVRANSDIEIKSYWQDTIKAWQRLVAEYLQSVFLRRFWPEQRLQVRWDTSEIMALKDTEAAISTVSVAYKNAGMMTVNEGRKRLGLEAYPHPNADKLYFMGRPIEEWDIDPMAQIADGPPKKESKPEPKRVAGPQLRVIPSHLMDEDEEVRALKEKVRAVIRELYRIAGEQLLESSKVPGGSVHFSVTDPIVMQFIEAQTIRVSESTVKTTIEMVRRVIAEAAHSGVPIAQMRDDLQEAFVERRADWQLDRIARTEVHQAQEGSGWLAMKQNGIEFKRWITSRDSKVRGSDPKDHADHVHLDNQILGIDDRFTDSRSGGRMLYPGDTGAAAVNIINCRCGIVGDFSHLRDWATPDFDQVWSSRVATAITMERAVRRFFNREIEGMERRALAEFDRQTAQAAA